MTRRQRRAAMRREEARRAAAVQGTGQPAWRSPIALVSLAAVVVAIVVIVALNVGRGGSGSSGLGPGASGASGVGAVPVTPPASPIPASIPRTGRTLGSPTAKVVLDLWEDFQCPGCGSFSRSVEPVVIQRYVATGQLRLTFHDYAFIGQESKDAALAARCADKQGRFWDYQAWLFANQNGENKGSFTRDRLAAMADAVGLDDAVWASCYDGGADRTAVTDETTSGVSAGVTSTPTLILDGTVLDLTTFKTWDQLFQAIDVRIAASGGSPGSIVPGSPSP
jgi:protein-disulfide isomerase